MATIESLLSIFRFLISMRLSACAMLTSLSLLVGCQGTSSTDNSPLAETSSVPSTPAPKLTSEMDNLQVTEPQNTIEKIDIVCPQRGINPITVTVSDLWQDGEVVTEAYTGRIAQVDNGTVTFTPSRHSGGLLLLESMKEQAPFQWQSATFYHIATDRFFNGNSWNDHSYGRPKATDGFQGGDIAGLTQKLDYLAELGVDVLWISTPLEQVHGWLPDESGNASEYPFAGGATIDWTQLDTNMGSEQEMRTFVDSAHLLGMRVVWSVDTIPSKPSLADLQQFNIQPQKGNELPSYWNEWQPESGQNLTNYLDAFKDETGKVPQWWSAAWSNPNHVGNVTTPAFFRHKPVTAVSQVSRDKNELLTQWITTWVAKFGIDGVVLSDATPQLVEKIENSASQAFELWKKSNQYKALESSSFLVIDLNKKDQFEPQLITQQKKQSMCFSQFNHQLFSTESSDKMYAINWFENRGLDELSESNFSEYRDIASALLLSQGSIAMWYGDETGKSGQAYSSMNWEQMTGERLSLVSHWKKLLAFRSNHSALSDGEYQLIENKEYYAFSRTNKTDNVMIVYTGE